MESEFVLFEMSFGFLLNDSVVAVSHASFMPSKSARPCSSSIVGSISMVLTIESSTAPVGKLPWGYEIISGTRVRQS